ncbi:hypothetical protein HZB74_02165 [Candidatus Saccharibacteria bacterium]|nr:hypothetical protein [Candidatus Saccharibacteria bacterium]
MMKINIFQKLFSRNVAVGIVFLLTIFLIPGYLKAQSLNQGYKSDEPLQKGMLVTERDDDSSKIVAVTHETLNKLKGVVIQQNDAPFTVAAEGENVFVANSGIYEVLVSNENGEIKSGDYVSISSLSGVGMKATEDQLLVLGRATTDFKGEGDSVGSSVIGGINKKVNFGRIPVAISITRNPWLKESKTNSIPKVLQNVSVSIAGKQVNTARIWMATAVFLASVIVTGVMLYSGARSSLISVGRNPLSKSILMKGLMQVVLLSLIIFISGMFAVYLLLKL